ncbi:MAG: methylenetetrahydrofolate--tRNA-(uracil(54)-C(5))-methyltransferase (FADH(2)-oxidizing) TrmFO [Clostridiales bacterium]|nr:methylenetetrahydrofolate--tRNA-(uracil(54)-C(5))-methyltransferase (FADH(2)-oxidizing) TrmFO [Clostridiales bacterium]
MDNVTVIGAGLAGCESAWQLARRGIKVRLIEMKPLKRTPAHISDNFAELVCSNSLRSDDPINAVGLLKEELRLLGSLIMECADATRVKAGKALAVDRIAFSRLVTEKIRSSININIECSEAISIPDGIVIIATGPLTSDALSSKITELIPNASLLHFFDAAAPIVTHESIDLTSAYYASRYDRGDADYINCPMDKEQYIAFRSELMRADQAEIHGFEDNEVFEGCVPIEVLARRAEDTMRYGPLKPVGLRDPLTGRQPYAVVQLRRDNSEGSLYNLVGFQTHLTFPEQRRVFSMIPALRNAEFVRFGVMHRNTYLNSPGLLDEAYRLITNPRIRFSGQITGVEGYVESTASGLLCALQTARELSGKKLLDFTRKTAIGALAGYISNETITNFQPMNVNFGIVETLDHKVSGKKNRNSELSARALGIIKALLDREKEV